MHFLDTAELQTVEILILISIFSPEASIFVCSQRLFYTATCPLGDRRLSVSQRLKMYYFYDKVSWGHVVCPLYGGDLYLVESVMGGSTV